MEIFASSTELLAPQTPISRIINWVLAATVGAIVMTISPAVAAERVEFGFGPVKVGIAVKELEAYAKRETIGKELDTFISPISESDRKYVKQFLTLRSDFKPSQVSNFFHSAVGEKILIYLGDLVQIDRNLNGSKAIRSGLISAAADRDGLSLLNFLRKYPTPILRLNLEKGFEVANKIDKLGQETKNAISGVEQLSLELAKSEPKIDPQTMASLAISGSYPVKLQTEILKDASRQRQFTVDFYVPQGVLKPAPAIVLSHGLGSDRQHFAAISKHLASHGFVAVTVEHPGSNTQKLQKLFKGLSKEVFDVSEFIDRPKDVSYILDDLERRFAGVVNVQQAGVIGHSFGGYTALALAGAVIDFDYLAQQCSQGIDSANASLLLQCEALKLPRQSYKFRDNRIKLALAINPIDSSIFGPKGMASVQIPVAIAASSEDTVASAVLEQIQPFSWMNAPERYLFVVRGVGHIADIRSFIRAFMPSLDSFLPDKNIEPLKEYSRTFVLALVQTHLRNRRAYRRYLQAGYAIAISQTPNQVSILRSLTPEQLNTMLQ